MWNFRKVKKFLIGISTKLFLALDRATNKSKSNGKLAKVEQTETEKMVVESDDGEMEDQLDVECETVDVVESSDEALDDQDKIEPEPILLPGVSSFFSAGKTKAPVEESSDDEDEVGEK